MSAASTRCGRLYPIGEEPSNKSWTGFQAVHPDGQHGYLTIFRERENGEPTTKVALRLLAPGSKLALKDLRTGGQWTASLDERQQLNMTIARAPDFLFLEYTK